MLQVEISQLNRFKYQVSYNYCNVRGRFRRTEKTFSSYADAIAFVDKLFFKFNLL